ncbi:MAG: hypothetical protein HOI66_22640 [Verrucomicrobia bacterium]|jgi:hypothetical protein|nr:hypothetical protein [Verrucomicrobiota bacterium]MDA7645726.1 hypothetical protein [bacterium]
MDRQDGALPREANVGFIDDDDIAISFIDYSLWGELDRVVTMKTTLLSAILVLGLGCLSACSHRNPSATFSPVGTYQLVEVNGQAIPTTVHHGGIEIRVVSGQLVLTEAGDGLSETVFGPPAGAKVHRRVEASYTQSGNELLLRWKGAGMTKGTLGNEAFTMNNEGMIFSYRKK